jgi:ribose-phosphate pyrophosphokinase
MDNAKIFCGTSNVPLAKAVCKYLDVPLGKSEVRRFSDGEVFVEYRSARLPYFVIQSTCPRRTSIS